MAHFHILKEPSQVCETFQNLIGIESDPLANWNTNRRGYIAFLLEQSFLQTENKFQFIRSVLAFPASINRSLSVAKRRELTRPLLGRTYLGACRATSSLKSLICLIEIHFSCEKVVRFEPWYQQNFGKKDVQKSLLFQKLPDLPKCVLSMSTPSLVKETTAHIPEKWLKVYRKYIQKLDTYSSKANSIACYRRLIFSLGLKEFYELNDRAVKDFIMLDGATSIRNYGIAVDFFRDLGSLDLSSLGVASAMSGFQSRTNRSIAEKTTSPNKDINFFRLRDSNYRSLVGASSFKLTGVDKVVVTQKRVGKYVKVTIGEYEFQGSWRAYSYQCLIGMNSPWIKSQGEFLKSQIESSTRKNVAKSLEYLNVYLFNYLEYFFGKNDVPYPYPDNISDFKSAIYVSTSEIVSEHLYQSTKIKFPISLIEWLKLTHESVSDSVLKSRALTISKYFEFVIAKYSGIEGYELDRNPLSSFETRRFQAPAYKRSNKKLFGLEYWKLFSEFLYVLADRLIKNIEDGVTVSKRGDIEVVVDRYIEFGDYSIHINKLKNTEIKRCNINGAGYAQPQKVLAYLIMAKTGLRMATVMNLDVRNYDAYFIDTKEYQEDDDVELYVNTDKAKQNSYESRISYPVFSLIQRFVSVRDSIHGAIKKPIPYNGSENSKWGHVLPILATSANNSWDNFELPHLLNAFEKELLKSGLNFGSEVFYKPKNTCPSSFRALVNSNQTTKCESYCVHYSDGVSAFFTPIVISSHITPHSFRKTLDTYYSILIGDKNTGKFFTGQTEATVGYYREASPEAWNKVMLHAENISLPNIIPVKSVFKDEMEIRRKLINEGIGGINGFTLSPIRTDVGVKLSTIDPSEIAVNQTHICIYGNSCPPEILSSLEGKKNCAICPVSISTPYDGVAIAAQIKYHVENIAEINQQLKADDLPISEKSSLISMRVDELDYACSWFVRHKFLLRESQHSDRYVVLDDGEERVRTKLEYVIASNYGEEMYARLLETSSIPSLQSNKLKQVASRLSRKLIKILDKGEVDLPDIKPVEVAIALIRKVAEVHGLPMSQLNELTHASISDTNKSIDEVLRLGGLYEESN